MQNSEIMLYIFSAKLPFSLSCDKTLDSFQKLKVNRFISTVSITQLRIRMSAFSRKINKTFCLSYFKLVPLPFLYCTFEKEYKVYKRANSQNSFNAVVESFFACFRNFYLWSQKGYSLCIVAIIATVQNLVMVQILGVFSSRLLHRTG